MTATLILLRHAEHRDYNQRFSGRGDCPLSEAGEIEARALGQWLIPDHIDRIECSPLMRTRQTAQAIADATGVRPVHDAPALIELDMGAWTGRALSSLQDDPAWREWNEHRGTARIPGGETMGEAQSRIAPYLREVAAANPGKTVALVTHADMIRAAVADVLGLPLDNLLRFDIEPASITRLVMGDWGARVLNANEKVRMDGVKPE